MRGRMRLATSEGHRLSRSAGAIGVRWCRRRIGNLGSPKRPERRRDAREDSQAAASKAAPEAEAAVTKREREALREYVDAVCQFAEAQGSDGIRTKVEEVQVPSDVAWKPSMTPDEYRHASGRRLNAADDRLRALGMLP